jgi:hypoxanthine phosphoribosyltransferase
MCGMKTMNKKVLYSKEDIAKRVEELAVIISREYEGRDVVFVGILKGAFMFLADLVRTIAIPHSIDFMRVASYGSETVSSGKVRVTKDVETPMEGKDIIVVEDIIDTGITLAFLKEYLKERNPNSVKVCTLLDKKERRQVEIDADYVGFTLGEGFIVGYGLDFNERFRSLPDIYVIET